VQSKWNEVKTLVPQRDQTLQDELKKQQNNEALRRQFAEKSNQVLQGERGGGMKGLT
jgi:actinin alpha